MSTYYQLILHFDPPIPRHDYHYWHEVCQTLSRLFPNLTWGSGNPLNTGYWPGSNTISYLFLRKMGYGDLRLYRGTTVHKGDIDVVVNGRDWIRDNIDYDQTSKIFDQLNEFEEKGFKIGDEVYLRRDSEYFGSRDNPDTESTIGIITNVSGYILPIVVDWGGYENTYNTRDLALYIEPDYSETSKIFDQLNESEEPKIQKGDILYCHTNLVMSDDNSIEATKDRVYEVKGTRSDRQIWILNDSINEHFFDIDPHSKSYYGRWFQLIPGGVLPNTEEVFNQLFESESVDRYSLEDLEFFYNNKTRFYEISPKTNKPFPPDDMGNEADSVGILYFIGKERGYYDLCWYEIDGDRYKTICYRSGPLILINQLNIGRLVPVDIYNAEVSSHDLFDKLNESEEDDFSWVPQNFEIPEIGEPFLILIYNPRQKLDIIQSILELCLKTGYEIYGGIGDYMDSINHFTDLVYIRPEGSVIKYGTRETTYIDKTGLTFSESNPIYL